MKTMPDDAHAACRERLSALMDGELSGPALQQACGHWREAEESRSTWHLYHVIGDVLRSDDLADGAARQAHFLHALRGRMSAEPVVLAPAPLLATRVAQAAASRTSDSRAETWRRPAVIAAGLVAVVGIVWLGRLPLSTGRDAPAFAAASPSTGAPAGRVVAFAPRLPDALAPPVEPRSLAPGDPLIRDARLDRYLAAHQQFARSSALGVPSGFLRASTAESARR